MTTMPRKDPEARKQYQRELYARNSALRERVKAHVRAYKALLKKHNVNSLKELNEKHDNQIPKASPYRVLTAEEQAKW